MGDAEPKRQQRLSVMIDEHLHEQLLAKAARERRTLTAVVEMALERACQIDASTGGTCPRCGGHTLAPLASGALCWECTNEREV